MEQKNYHSTIETNVSPKRAFNSINSVTEWWDQDVTGSSQKLRDEFTVRFGDTSVDFRIIEMVPDQKVVWEVTDCYLPFLKDKTEWKGTKVIFEISERNSLTRIDMTHEGLVPGIECYENCEKGWNLYFKESLYKLLTTGKGVPTAPKERSQQVADKR
jgi:hypothetical protein